MQSSVVVKDKHLELFAAVYIFRSAGPFEQLLVDLRISIGYEYTFLAAMQDAPPLLNAERKFSEISAVLSSINHGTMEEERRIFRIFRIPHV